MATPAATEEAKEVVVVAMATEEAAAVVAEVDSEAEEVEEVIREFLRHWHNRNRSQSAGLSSPVSTLRRIRSCHMCRHNRQ